MGSIATISVNDSSAVSHDFVPSSFDGIVARYREESASSTLGFYPLSVSLKNGSESGGVDRFRMALAMPIVQTETINGVSSPKVVMTLRANVEYILPAGSTLLQKQDLNAFVQNLLASTAIKDVAENGHGIY